MRGRGRAVVRASPRHRVDDAFPREVGDAASATGLAGVDRFQEDDVGAARRFAQRTKGVAQSAVTESLRNMPTTAHILGGAVIGAGPESGVVDASNRAFGYENLLVTDGASIPANPGVNPSLTITAKAEHAMSLIPPKEGAEPRDLPKAARPATPVAS